MSGPTVTSGCVVLCGTGSEPRVCQPRHSTAACESEGRSPVGGPAVRVTRQAEPRVTAGRHAVNQNSGSDNRGGVHRDTGQSRQTRVEVNQWSACRRHSFGGDAEFFGHGHGVAADCDAVCVRPGRSARGPAGPMPPVACRHGWSVTNLLQHICPVMALPRRPSRYEGLRQDGVALINVVQPPAILPRGVNRRSSPCARTLT
jgi:hypothetical protein